LLERDAGSWFYLTNEKAEIAEIDDKCRNRQFLREIRVPLYIDVLKYCYENHIFMNVEIKPVPGYERRTAEIICMTTLRFLESVGQGEGLIGSNIMFSSFSFESLLVAKELAPLVPRALLSDSILENWLSQLEELDAVAMHTNYKSLNQELAQDILSRGYLLLCYTVNDIDVSSELFEWGVHCLCTDRLDLMR
jgi:glycerophosphoryl diester phosphodiesterase